MKWKVNAEWFENKVTKLENVIKMEKNMPPLIVHFVDDAFELNDGNHRLEAYSRLGIKEIYVIIWITDKHEYELFLSEYSEYLNMLNDHV